jgi:hypothetical protein
MIVGEEKIFVQKMKMKDLSENTEENFIIIFISQS